LIDNNLSDDEQAELISHLDSCECCQHCLEELASGGASWCASVKHADCRHPDPGSAFWPALNAIAKDATNPEQVVAVQATPRSPVPAPLSDHFDVDGEDDSDPALDFLSPAEVPNTIGRLGHFHITGLLGRGGMGLVLKALDQCLQRQVAIKVLTPKLANNETARKRFCREARAAAAVTHENVVAVYEVEHDEDQDLPYLVMQYVAGESLQERLDKVSGPLPLMDVLRIGVQTAAGLAAAHAQGLIHRDIKPANILLEAGTDKVKLTDFGLARAAEDARLTRTGFIAGTPLYMAPEQAKGEELDHRTDLFSLGSVLYTLATGKPPFDASTPFLVLRRVTEEVPKPVRELNRDVPEGLAEVIDRLHAKSPTDRYQSASEVAEALARQLVPLHTSQVELANLPVPKPSSGTNGKQLPPETRPPLGSVWSLGALTAILLVGLLTVGQFTGMIRLLPSIAPSAHEDTSRATLQSGAGGVRAIAFAPDSKMLAMATSEGFVKLWDVQDGRVKLTINAHRGPIWSTSFCLSGEALYTASEDGTVKRWDVATGNEKREFTHSGSVRALAISCNSKAMVTGGGDGGVRIWDVVTGVERVKTKGHDKIISTVAFAPDGQSVASGGGDKVVKVWDVKTGREELSLPGHTEIVTSLAFSPDGALLASGSIDGTVRLWTAATGASGGVLDAHAGEVLTVAFSTDGKTIAAGGQDGAVRVWDVAQKRLLATLRGHNGTVQTVTFSPDGKTMASGSRDGTVKLWNVVAGQ
jgi:serine/threonine protein kinase